MTRLFTFIGVTTGQSAILRIFPRWRDLLGLDSDVELTCWDLPIHAPEERYREAVRAIRDDPENLGAVVTTHKLDLYRAARDLFAEVNEYTRRLDEVSCISKDNGRLQGWALDPVSIGRALDEMLGPRYFTDFGGEVLCCGAGGAGMALTLYFLHVRRDDPPARLIVSDRSEKRLNAVRALHRARDTPIRVESVLVDSPAATDRIVESMKSASLIVNATGMGKDSPGSPVGNVLFPHGSIAWDMNYRGELGFLRDAAGQAASRGVRVEDGWRLFIHGWAVCIEKVFARPLNAFDVHAMADAASFARPVHTAFSTDV